MLAAPATMAAPPRMKSSGSSTPAVPPPPVDGAPTGIGLADWVRVAAGWVRVAADREAAGAVAPGSGLAGVAVLPGERLPVAEPLLPGENVGGVAEGGDDEQAATEASMAAVTQLAAVSLALSLVPALTMCTLMGSPHASGRRPGPFQVPVPER
jgi:hypothetical protein